MNLTVAAKAARTLGLPSLALGVCLGVAATASAQTLQVGGASAHYGTKKLSGGFTPDPMTVSITSGGTVDASSAPGLPSGCQGYVSERPDYILTYSDAASFLRIFVESAGDTTLVINDGAGNWYCDDDSGGGTNPMVDLRRPVSGHYDIWVGSYSRGERIRGTLSITELESARPAGAVASSRGNSGSSSAALQVGGSYAHFGEGRLRGGFAPDPAIVRVTSGGSLSAKAIGGSLSVCAGYVTSQPDYILDYQNAASFLRFYVEGSGDTALIINDAAGNWHCDDDSGGGLNPMVDVRNPPSGRYDIWVGSYSASERIQGTLNITELERNRPSR